MDSINTKQVKIAKRYAQALTKFDSKDAMYLELCKVNDILVQSLDLKQFLSSPLIPLSDKKDVITKVFGDFSQDVQNFLLLLTDKNRFSYFDTIFSVFKAELDEINNIKRVEVVSAIEMLDEEKNKLTEKLVRKLNRQISTEYTIDESILGGLIVKIGDKVIDNSLKSKMDGLKRQLI